MSFHDVIGQAEAKKLLERSLRKERIASAYLFYGPEGIGKTITALNFARALNCKNHEIDSCSSLEDSERCSSCKKIDSSSHPDIMVVFPAPKKAREGRGRNDLLKEGKTHEYQKTEIITIGDIRTIEESLLMKPFEAKKRVVIIVDAETMRAETQNALLKVLEEPPRDTTIILTSSEPERLFSTIRSRCQQIQFKRLSEQEMFDYLKSNYNLADEEIRLICMLSRGSIKRVNELVGKEKREERESFKSLVTNKDYEKLLEISNKEALDHFIQFLVLLLRDIYVVEEKGKLLNLDSESYIRSVRKKYSNEELQEIIELLGDSIINIKRNVNPQLIANVVYDKLKEG